MHGLVNTRPAHAWQVPKTIARTIANFWRQFTLACSRYLSPLSRGRAPGGWGGVGMQVGHGQLGKRLMLATILCLKQSVQHLVQQHEQRQACEGVQIKWAGAEVAQA